MRSAESCLLVLESVSAATDLDLISYLRSIPDELMRCGVRFLSWYLLVVATIGFLVPLLLPKDGCDGKTVGRVDRACNRLWLGVHCPGHAVFGRPRCGHQPGLGSGDGAKRIRTADPLHAMQPVRWP